MYYIIDRSLNECTKEELLKSTKPYVAILNTEDWKKEKNIYKMGIDFEPKTTDIYVTKAEENYDSITGTFFIPNRNDIQSEEIKFAFALDEKGIVFIDDGNVARRYIRNIKSSKRWRLPSLERFIYDFLNQIIRNDFRLIERYEHELDELEDEMVTDESSSIIVRLSEIRADLRDLRNHYEQLLDISELFEANENGFFEETNLRYFRIFLNRVERLIDLSSSIRDYTIQVRDAYKMHLDIKQNHIMTLFTVITTIFTPLTLIVGWYGMNFKYMPELEYTWSYPTLFVACILLSLFSLLYFKHKNWLQI